MKAKRKTTTKPPARVARARPDTTAIFPPTTFLTSEEMRSWVNMALDRGAVFYIPLDDGRPRLQPGRPRSRP